MVNRPKIRNGLKDTRLIRGRKPGPKPKDPESLPGLADVRRIAESVLIYKFYDYREYLSAVYEAIKAEFQNYSYLEFAEDLGFGKTNVLWLVISGRRKLTARSAVKLSESLQLGTRHSSFLQTLSSYNNTADGSARDELFAALVRMAGAELQRKQKGRMLEYFQEWFHPIIRELTATEEFSSDPSWISERLCIKVAPLQIRKSLELLEELNLIAYDQNAGRHRRTDIQVRPDREFEAMTMIRYHQKMTEIARDSLAMVPANRRNFNALTVAVTDDGIRKIGAILEKACEDILAVEKAELSTDQVCHVNLQVFPVTKTRLGTKKKRRLEP